MSSSGYAPRKQHSATTMWNITLFFVYVNCYWQCYFVSGVNSLCVGVKKYSYREDVSDMRVSKYFERVCWGRTQTVLIRHPWLSSTFPRHRVGELLCVEQNIKIPGCLNINPCRNIFLPRYLSSRFFLILFYNVVSVKGVYFLFYSIV